MTALFKDNYFDTIELLSQEQRESIKNNDKDYIVINVQCTNNSAWIDLDLTNDFPVKEMYDGECTVFDDTQWETLVDNYEYQTGKKFYN